MGKIQFHRKVEQSIQKAKRIKPFHRELTITETINLFVYETQAIQEIEELAQRKNSVRKFKRTRA